MFFKIKNTLKNNRNHLKSNYYPSKLIFLKNIFYS
jgi:hypothetical protein